MRPGAEPEPLPLAIVFEDDDLIVVDKPPGLVVHPGAGVERGTLVNALLHHAPSIRHVGGAQRPGIVHRLDKDTSGLMVVAKSERAHRVLVEAIQRARGAPRILGAGVGQSARGSRARRAPRSAATRSTASAWPSSRARASRR